MNTLKTGAAILAFSGMAGHALAETVCAGAQDLTALQVATLQQELTVAALTCQNDDVSLYNSFVTAYQSDLIASDHALESFFLRRDAINGTADFHTFKTKLANNFSTRHSEDPREFCSKAEAIFHEALTGKKKSLAVFALSQPMEIDASYTVCGETVKGESFAMAVKPPEPKVEKQVVVAPPAAAPAPPSYEAPRVPLPPTTTYRYSARDTRPASSCMRMSSGYLDCYYGGLHYFRDPYGRYLPPPQAYWGY